MKVDSTGTSFYGLCLRANKSMNRDLINNFEVYTGIWWKIIHYPH